jgi:hypothetical protein
VSTESEGAPYEKISLVWCRKARGRREDVGPYEKQFKNRGTFK